MKYVKMLALAAVAAGALIAFIGAGTASASKICSTNVSPCPAGQNWPAGTVLDFSIAAGGSANLVDTEGGTLDTCKESTVKGSITNAGSSTATVTGGVTELTWGTCTWPTKTLKTGNLEVHSLANGNGTVTADGTFDVTILNFAGTCVYRVTAGTDLGEITEGNPAIFHANAVAEEPFGTVICPDTARWTATYTLTSPSGTTAYVTSS